MNETQRTQIKTTGGPSDLNGTLNPQYNPNGTAEGGSGEKVVMTQEGGQKTVENTDNPAEVKIDNTWGPKTIEHNLQKDSTFEKREYKTSDNQTGTKILKAEKGAWNWSATPQ